MNLRPLYRFGLLSAVAGLLGFNSCSKPGESPSYDNMEGLVLNEICPSAALGKEGWIELYNTSSRTIKLNGLVIRLSTDEFSDEEVAVLDAGEIAPAAYHVISTEHVAFSRIFLRENFKALAICDAGGYTIDRFSLSFNLSKPGYPVDGGSYSRIPNAGQTWTISGVATRGAANKEGGAPGGGSQGGGTPGGGDSPGDGNTTVVTGGNKIALWVPQSATASINLDNIAKLGIGHILLHEWAYKNYGTAKVSALVTKAHSLGIKVHIWLQCFWWNDDTKWRSPVIDATGSSPAKYNQALFDDVIGRAKNYMDLDIDGIHFDYVRFPGTAYKHNFSNGITGIGAITEFCRQASVALRAKNPKIILSAAVMGESDSAYYYGQDTEKMCQYIDIIMPMAYISSYGYTASGNVNVANWFANHCNGKQCWHGIATYDKSEKALSASQILSDCSNIAKNSKAQGIALFRYGIGTLPDLSGLYSK